MTIISDSHGRIPVDTRRNKHSCSSISSSSSPDLRNIENHQAIRECLRHRTLPTSSNP